MPYECHYTGKKTNFGKKRAYSGQKITKGGFGLKTTGISRRTFRPNLHKMTAMVDGYGREVARGNPATNDPAGWHSAVVRTGLPARLENTPYQRFGETFYWLTLVLFGGLAFVSWRR